VVIACDDRFELLAKRRCDCFQRRKQQTFRHFRHRFERGLYQRQCFDRNRSRSQRADAQKACDSCGDVDRVALAGTWLRVPIHIRVRIRRAGCAERFEAKQQRPQQRNGARQIVAQGEGILFVESVAGQPRRRRKMRRPVDPAAMR